MDGLTAQRVDGARQGGRTSVVESRITGDDGDLRAFVVSTLLILDRALQPPA